MSPVEKFIELLQQHPEDFKCDDYTLAHKTGVSIWITNMPILDVRFYKPTECPVSFLEKWALWKAYRHWQRNFILSRLKKEATDGQD